MSGLWSRSSRAHQEEDWTPIAGETPEEIGTNFAATVDTSGMSEAEKLQAALEEAEQWSDDPREQGQYLYGLKQGLGL